MHLNFCTLFDSNYLDKGITMYESLEKNTRDYTLYIFAFDDKAYEYIRERNLPNVVVIPEKEILNNRLTRVKECRTRAEYCWTCTPIIIEYVLENRKCSNCTYLDSDIYFFDDPRILIGEMLENNCSVLVTPHYFNKSIENFLIEKMYGKYCVQFNTFLNNEEGKKVLRWWREQCYVECTVKSKWSTYGDQKYQNSFENVSTDVYELNYRGGGVAPWNIGQFRCVSDNDEKYTVYNKYTCKEYSLVFYHFQGLKNMGNNLYDIAVYVWQGKKVDHYLVKELYSHYVQHLERNREKINKRNGKGIDETEKVNKSIAMSKKIKRFECGIFKQTVMSIVGILGYRRKKIYKKYDCIEIKL